MAIDGPPSSSAEPPTLFFKGMPRVVERGDFLALIRAHLPPEVGARIQGEDVVFNMGRGTGVMRAPDRAAAQLLMEAGAAGQLKMGSRTLKVTWGEKPFRPRDTSSAAHREREVRRCVDDLCRNVATNFAAHRRELRRQRWRAQKQLLAELDAVAEREGKIARDFCWDFAASGGRSCLRGQACPFRHTTDVSIAALPPSVRLAVAKGDMFKAQHAANPHKARVNATLARLAVGVPNPRCLVLDDAHLHTVRALLGDDDGEPSQRQREPADIVVPNVVTETHLKMKATGLCTAVPGSVRAYIDSLEADNNHVGLFYLDYCGRLSAGKGNVEMSPVEDIKALFAKRLPDPRGCILAVCLRREEEPEEAGEEVEAEGGYDDGSRALRELVCRLAAQHGRVATLLPEEGHAYGDHFVTVFRVQGN